MRISLEALALLALGVAQASASKKQSACSQIAKFLPDEVALPGSQAYTDSSIYWSERQAEQHPDCYVTPRSTKDVSRIVETLIGTKTRFSVKSGGHTPYQDASNTEKGVTIDLVKLNQVTVLEDRKTASIGPGNRWGDVNQALDPQGLAVVGGRVATVGVGGLLLGGGLSWFSGKRGLACDQVRAYEVVLASGEVVIASPTKNKDLFRALRGGGGSNFGIVTRFDLVAFEQKEFWGKITYFPAALDQAFIPSWIDMVINELPKDPGAHTYMVEAYDPATGTEILSPYFSHMTVPAEGKVPAIFQQFQALPNAFVNETIVATASVHSAAISSEFGKRQSWWTTSVEITSPELFLEIADMYRETLAKLIKKAGTSYMSAVIEYQPLTSNMLKAGASNGGNSLGIRAGDAPVMVIAFNPLWEDASLDKFVEKTSRDFIKAIEKLARKEGVFVPFKYMNYANREQDVYRSYGRESYEGLKKAARRYDPKGLLKKYWKGYFRV